MRPHLKGMGWNPCRMCHRRPGPGFRRSHHVNQEPSRRPIGRASILIALPPWPPDSHTCPDRCYRTATRSRPCVLCVPMPSPVPFLALMCRHPCHIHRSCCKQRKEGPQVNGSCHGRLFPHGLRLWYGYPWWPPTLAIRFHTAHASSMQPPVLAQSTRLCHKSPADPPYGHINPTESYGRICVTSLRAYPHYEGRIGRFAKRHLHYRGHPHGQTTRIDIEKRYENDTEWRPVPVRPPLVMEIPNRKSRNVPLITHPHYEGRNEIACGTYLVTLPHNRPRHAAGLPATGIPIGTHAAKNRDTPTTNPPQRFARKARIYR